MKWIGQHIWDLTSRFRNDIYFEGLAETAETRGLVVDANGKVSINPLSGDEHATHIYENVRNDEGATIPVGTPVYSKGEIGGSERIKVGIAKASDPNRMPAIGITNTELTTTGSTMDGLATLVGVYNTNISGFSGIDENEIVYVAPSGGLTTSKPAGTNLIQNVGIILKTNGTIIQGLQVTCIGRTNDIPNSLQLRKADGTNAGLISMTGNDMVLSNATGDVLIGSTTYQVGGDQDIFIGDGTNSVDLIFEQPGSIRGYDSSVNLTIGGGGGVITFADAVEFTNDITVSSLNYASSRGWVEDSQPMYSQTGFYGGNFIRNGEDAENETVWGLDPFGNKGLLWKAIQGNTDDSGDGGWNKDITIPANNNVGYISYVYFKIDFTPDNNNDGSFYHGCGQNTGETLSLSGTSNTNPYFNSGRANELGFGGTPLEANKWYLSVGIIQAYNNSTTDTDTVSGIYEVDTGKKIRSGSEFKMGNNTTGQRHRVYWYYSTTSDVQNAYFWGPGFHAIDGTEPKIQDLVRSASFSVNYQAGRDAQNFIDFTTDNVIKFTTNSSEALRIDSSGRVGINTTNPSSELEVASSGANGIVLGEDAGNSTLSSRLFFANATPGQGVALLNGGGGLAFFTGSTPGSTSGTERIKISSTGSLGIGTSNPSEKLHVVGDALLDGDLTVNGINYGLYHATTEDGYYSDNYEGSRHLTMFIKNARADIIRYASIGNIEYWNGSSWQDGSSQLANVKKLLDGRQDTSWSVPSTYYKFRFTVSPSTAWPTRAKIGIQTSWSGSTWPGATMLVEEYDGSSWATKVTADFGGQAGGGATPLNSNDNDVDNWGLMFKADNALHTGNGNSSSYNSGLNTRITIDFYGWSPSNPSYVTIPLQNIFITSNYAGTENTDYTNLLDYDRNVTIPNDMTVNGDVGIGTASPSVKLHVQSANETVARIERTSGSGYTVLDIKDGVGTTGNSVILFSDTASSKGSINYEHADDSMRFTTNANEAMRIDNSGNVGIGLTATSSLFHVSAADGVMVDTFMARIQNQEATAGDNFGLYVQAGSNSSDISFRVTDKDANEYLRVRGDGNVGIGTTSPDSLLHVSADVSSGGVTNTGTITIEGRPAGYLGDDIATIDFHNTGVKYADIRMERGNAGNDSQLVFSTSDTGTLNDALIINEVGNVGIGTSSPSQKLDVVGDVKIHNTGSGNDATLFIDTVSGGNADSILNFREATVDRASLYWDGGDNDLYLTTTTGDFIINPSGNVGIGTTSPGKLLDVNGTFRAIGEAFFNGAIDVTAGLNSRFRDGTALNFNTNRTARIFTDANDLIIQQGEDDKDIIFKCDDGSGGVETYFFLDGSEGVVNFPDNKRLTFGTGRDLFLYHDGTNATFKNYVGDIVIQNEANDKDIIFKSDDGSGGTAEYFRVDGLNEQVVFSKNLKLQDNDILRLGDANDLQLFHDGFDSMIDNLTGNFYIRNQANDKDIIFICDNGSGGTETYFRLDGSASSGDPITIFPDNSKLAIGESSHGITLVHDGSNSSITNAIGDLTITNFQDDGDIIFKSDDGSGSTTEYFRVDGGSEKTIYTKPISLLDSVGLQLGTGTDAQMYHTGSEGTFINYTGNFRFIQSADDADLSFYSDDGSGGVTPYLTLDGSLSRIQIDKNMLFVDSKAAFFGNSQDLQIYHDGSHSYIKDTGTGNLRVDATNFFVRNAGGTKIAIDAIDGAEVALRYDGSRKLETTSTGIEVTGKINATDINFSGLPTSSAGLSSGDVWNDGGTLKIVS